MRNPSGPILITGPGSYTRAGEGESEGESEQVREVGNSEIRICARGCGDYVASCRHHQYTHTMHQTKESNTSFIPPVHQSIACGRPRRPLSKGGQCYGLAQRDALAPQRQCASDDQKRARHVPLRQRGLTGQPQMGTRPASAINR